MPAQFNTTSFTASASSATVLTTVDTTLTDWVTFALTGTFVATVVCEGSHDNTNWFSLGLANGLATANSANAPTLLTAQTLTPYTRLRVSAYTSGTVTVTGRTEVSAGTPITSTTAVTATPANGTNYSLVAAASTNAAIVKSTGGNLFEITVSNQSAATVYVKLYNKATAPTVGTDTPIVTLPVAAASSINIEFGQVGKRFASGIGIATTANPAVTDTTVIGTGVVVSATYI